MPRTFTYDFRRTLLSTTVIVVIVITVVLSLAFVPFLKAAEPSSPIPSSNAAAVAYYDNSTGVNVIVDSYNQFGQAISGTRVNATAQSGSTIQNSVQSTNGSGLVHIKLNVPYPVTGTNFFSVMIGNGPGFQSNIPSASGAIEPIFGDINPVIDTSNSSRVDISVFYAGTGGSPPTAYTAYFQVNPSGPVFNESQMTRLGPMTGYFTIFALPKGTLIGLTDSVFVALYDAAGNQITGNGLGGYSFVTQSSVQQQSTIQSLASAFVGGLLGLFVPLMAILASYSTYGKDRVSGVLESVLARPVSRRGLSISRYASTSYAMVVAVVLTIAALDVVVYFSEGFWLTGYFLGATIAALSVEAAAFVGLLFAFSRLLRSGGALVGIGVGLWAILELFWSLIVYLIAYALRLDFGSATFYRLSVDSSFFNPAQFYSLVSSLSSANIGGFQFTPADYGITPYTLVAAGILWVALPLGLFLYLATKKD